MDEYDDLAELASTNKELRAIRATPLTTTSTTTTASSSGVSSSANRAAAAEAEAARLRAEIELLRSPPQPQPTYSPIPASYSSAPPSYTEHASAPLPSTLTPVSESASRAAQAEAEAARLRAEIERLRSGSAPTSTHSAISESASRAAQAEAEAARLKAEIERLRSGAFSESNSRAAQAEAEAARLKAEIERLRSTASTPSMDRAAAAEAETKRLREEIERLRTPKPADSIAKSVQSDPEIVELKKLVESLKPVSASKTTSASMSVTPSSRAADARLKALEDQEKALKEETRLKEEALKKQIEEQEKEKLQLKGIVSAIPPISDSEMNEALQIYDKRMMGLDIAFFFDCTGSMAPWIKACLDKVGSIMDSSHGLDVNGTTVHVAFVGYRDYCDGEERFVTSGRDFIPFNRINEMKALLSTVTAKGGGDAPEDVAGGLYKVSQLNWSSSTRLIIHFGDAPPHGTDYHEASVLDTYPDGDPDGRIPETFLKNFCSNGIDFYSVEINRSLTEIATRRFMKAYGDNEGGPASGRGQFYVLTPGDDASQFLPTVIKSIKTSRSNRKNVRRAYSTLS